MESKFLLNVGFWLFVFSLAFIPSILIATDLFEAHRKRWNNIKVVICAIMIVLAGFLGNYGNTYFAPKSSPNQPGKRQIGSDVDPSGVSPDTNKSVQDRYKELSK